jgi:pimeloyl-ACP methyl ester carboxylesterase
MREAIQATTEDGVTLRGELVRGPTATWIVCIHDADGDIDVWHPLITELAPEGWNMLALDLRGHGGSDGTAEQTLYHLDVGVGVDLARRHCAEHVSIVAAGIGAMAALESVARALDDPARSLADSLVLLSPGPLTGSDPARLRGDGLATMIISGAHGSQAADAKSIQQASIGWTIGVTFATDTRSTELLFGEVGAHIADKIGTFLREQSTLGGPGIERFRSSPNVVGRDVRGAR